MSSSLAAVSDRLTELRLILGSGRGLPTCSTLLPPILVVVFRISGAEWYMSLLE